MKQEAVKLAYPLSTPNGQVDTITLRRPKVKDLKRSQERGGTDAAQELALMADLAQEPLTPEDLEEMDLADYANVLARFRKMQTATG